MIQNIIDVRNLSKSFDISTKEPGLKGTIKPTIINNIPKYEFKERSNMLNQVSFFIITHKSFL